jgi:hypothetical protein
VQAHRATSHRFLNCERIAPHDLAFDPLSLLQHGILADADYTPLNLNFDRSELSLWTSAQLFRVFNEEQTNERQLDWIYRNIPGARVVRRCHHSIQVPPQPGQSTDYYHIDTPGIRLSDRAGGYGDRAGGKQMKYIRWLEDDLIEWPNDGHTLYYLAHSHHDYFELSPRPENLHHVHSAVKYFEQRVNVTAGSPEGRFWALVKIAEMQTRWLGDDAASEETYRRAIRMDPWRVDGFFYYAKLYRSLGNETEAERILGPTHTMQIPPRSWFVWHDLYRCVARLEYARTVWSLPIQHLTDGKIAQAIRALNNAQCSGGDVQVRTAILSALSSKRSLVQSRLAAVARGESVPRDPELNPRAGGTAGQVVRPPGWSAEKEEEKRRRREKVRERKEREAEEKERQKLAAEEEKTETAEADKLHPKSKPSSAAADEDDDTPRKKPRAPPAKRSTRDDDSADDPSDDGAPKKRSPPQKKQRAPRRDGEEEEEEDRPAPRKRASTKASTPEPTKAAEPIRPSPPLPDSAAHFSTLTSFLSFFRENEREILEAIDQLPLHPQEGSRDPTWQDVSRRIASLLAKMEKSARTKKGVETCRKYRRATTPYLRVIHEHRDVLKAPSKKIAKAWEQEHEELRAMCR